MEAYGRADVFSPSTFLERVRRPIEQLRTLYNPWRMLSEVPLQMNAGDQLLNGTADLIMESEDGMILVDHKVHGELEKELSTVVERYADQLYWYARVLLEYGEKAPTIYYLNFPIVGAIARVRL